MNKKFYSKTKEIGGVTYTAQFNGLSECINMVDECYISDDSRNISTGKMTKYILEHVIVEPKGLTPDDFADFDELNAVIKFGREVMQGKFRPEKEG